jgi:hypothetical protein
MPKASISNHPKVQEFLRSDRMQMIYSGCFDSIHYARSFVSRYSGLKQDSGFSTRMATGAAGRYANVEITKTREYYDAEVKLIDVYKNEIISIELQLTKFQI